ncbi:MAG: Gfo/Idh/MocA family oxidoreductase [Chloroflexota bacterium]|nr:Gfo/Idh/MocA family oxidoreductase [Chloroflexota bacterium]
MTRGPLQTSRPDPIGAIGTGLAMEKLHWPALKQLTDRFTITAFAERDGATAERFAAYSGAPIGEHHADYGELLRRDDIEAVVILLPIPLLYDAARAALAAGKHVLCEKPPGADLEQGRAFLQLEREFPEQKLLIAENFFYRDDLRLARSVLDAGGIGRVNVMAWRQAEQSVPRAEGFSSTPWRQRPQYRGGPHLDGGVHMIAQIRLLLGDVRRVHGLAQHANAKMGGPSDLTLNLAFVSGAIGNYTSIHAEIPVPPEDGTLRLYGSEAVMVFGRAYGEGARTFAIHRSDNSVEEHRVEGADGGYYNEWLNFHDALTAGEPIVGTVEQSFQNMLIVLRGLDSAEGAGEVDLSPDAPGGLAERPLPLWKPLGASGLFDGLPCRVSQETRRA